MTNVSLEAGKKGAITLSRNVLNAVFKMQNGKAYSEALAYVYLLCNANYTETEAPDGVRVPRGVMYVTKTELLCALDWYRSKLDRFLDGLKRAGLLEMERVRNGYLLRMLEYEQACVRPAVRGRQGEERRAPAAPALAQGGVSAPAGETDADGHGVPAFEEFWEQYHYVVGRQPVDRYVAERCWNELTAEERILAVAEIERYYFSLPDVSFARTAHNYLRCKSFVR